MIKKRSPRALDDALYERLVATTNAGEALVDTGQYEPALERFRSALAMLPAPIEDWEASTWVLAAIGDVLYILGRHEEARQTLQHAMFCPDALGNAFMHLRLGEVEYELKNVERAKDELARAYMAGGPDIFADEDPKYIQFLRRYMNGI
ncbi:MAG TPA: tetratricopeptide repeat protein [Thermoanaerobaculia bacterium]|nr:tetratricopeptide repeat protein [Thermoanaerobaculia bacterium]